MRVTLDQLRLDQIMQHPERAWAAASMIQEPWPEPREALNERALSLREMYHEARKGPDTDYKQHGAYTWPFELHSWDKHDHVWLTGETCRVCRLCGTTEPLHAITQRNATGGQ